MKNNKFTKISLVILTLALCLGAVFAMSISADEPSAQNTENGPVIISQNIQYKEMFRLMYAVDPATVVDPSAEITLNVYDVDPEINTSAAPLATMKATATSDAEQLGVLKDRGYDSAYIFLTTKGVSYNNMLQNFYAQVVDSDGTTGPVKRYSVAEYFYQMLASNPTDEVAKATYENAIAFGASVQQLLAKDSETPTTLVSDVRYVTVEGGFLDGKYTAGVYEKGTALNLSVDGAAGAKWTVVTYNATGETVSTLANQDTVTVPTDENVAKVLVTSGTVISYPAGYNDLNTLTKQPSYLADRNSPTFSLESDSKHGTYAQWDISEGNGRGGEIYLNNALNGTNGLTADTATAFEISFDVKMTTPGTATSGKEYLRFQLRNSSGTLIQAVDLYTHHPDATGDSAGLLAMHTSGSGNGYQIFTGVDATDWFHVRFVMYSGDTRLHVYINGSSTPYISIATSSNSLTYADCNYIRILNNAKLANTSVSVDNIFCGFINETNPNPPAAESEATN